MFCKSECKDIAHTFLHTIDPDYVILEIKLIAAL
jgi:hypothetical protein